MKTLKTEEVNGKAYANSTMPAGRSATSSKPSTTPTACIRRSAYKPPVEFEAELRRASPTANQDEALSLN